MPETDSRGRREQQERGLIEALELAACDLIAHGSFSEARTDGNRLLVRAGKHSFIIRNEGAVGPPGNREQMLDRYAAMVVRNLVGRVGTEGEGGG